MDKNIQCPLTQSWPTRKKMIDGKVVDIIEPLFSLNNKPNNLGITYKFGKKTGKLRKTKVVKPKHLKELED